MITREDYEAGRVRRRDGGEFRVYKFPIDGYWHGLIGETRVRKDRWCPASWFSDGTDTSNNTDHDLILAPRRRTVWVNLYLDESRPYKVKGDIHYLQRDAELVGSKNEDCLYVALPIEIEE